MEGYITDRFPYQGMKAQIVILAHEIIPKRPLVAADGPYFKGPKYLGKLFAMAHAPIYIIISMKSPVKFSFLIISNSYG